jgi:hypothetical protein
MLGARGSSRDLLASKIWALPWLASALVLGASCGPKGDEDVGNTVTVSCAVPQPCGGDIRGTWRIARSCEKELLATFSCAGTVGDGSGLTETGTMTFNADNSYGTDTDLSGTLKVGYPAICLGAQSCADLAVNLKATLPAEYESIRCAATLDGGCNCSFALEFRDLSERGIYSTDGSVLTQLRSNGVSLQLDYCAQGGSLTLVGRNVTTGNVARVVWLTKE